MTEHDPESSHHTTLTDHHMDVAKVQFKKRIVTKRQPRRRGDDDDTLSDDGSAPKRYSLQKTKRYEKGISLEGFSGHKKKVVSNEAETSSRFVSNQETEEDRWKLKSGGGLILQFTTTQEESGHPLNEQEESEETNLTVPSKKHAIPYNPWLTEIREVDVSQLKGIREQHAKTKRKSTSSTTS